MSRIMKSVCRQPKFVASDFRGFHPPIAHVWQISAPSFGIKGRLREVFTAEKWNVFWRPATTELRTNPEGEFHLCAVKGVLSNESRSGPITLRVAVDELQSRPCQVAMSTTLPSASMSDQNDGAWRSPRSLPPAAMIASTRCCAWSWGTETSTWMRLRGAM